MRRSATSCLHCDANLGRRGSTFAPFVVPVALGLLFAGCGDDSTPMGDGVADGTSTSDGVTSSGSLSMGESTVTDGSDSLGDTFGDSFGDEAAYGVPDSGIDSDGTTSTGEDTDTGSGGTSGTGGTGDTDTDTDTDGSDTDGSGTDTGTTGSATDGPNSGGIEPAYGVGQSGG